MSRTRFVVSREGEELADASGRLSFGLAISGTSLRHSGLTKSGTTILSCRQRMNVEYVPSSFVASHRGSLSSPFRPRLTYAPLLRSCSQSPLYRTSLLHLINLYLPRLSGTCLSRFILDLPDVPLELLSILQALCTDPDRSRGRVGLKTLRDLVVERPPLREDALRNLLELCTHAGESSRPLSLPFPFDRING